MDFFIDAKNDECVEKGCDNIRTTQSYCRLHYLRNWKVVQKKRDILKEGKLQEYIEELISKYPTKYIESLLSDLSDDKEFYKVLNELNITNEFDFEEEDFEADNDSDGDDDIGIEQTFTGSMRYEDTE
jgi:preprotein translocase subunit SecA